MYLLLAYSILFGVASAVEMPSNGSNPAATTYPVGDMRNCPLSADSGPMYRMEVLPGGGFDNLRNLDMGMVFAYNYSLCEMSLDGKYLLPDNVFVIPLQESKIHLFSEYFDHWDEYKDVTSVSINAGGSFGSIGGKFSAGYKRMKTSQYNDKSVSTRTQVRHKLYTAKIQPGAQLHPKFKASVIEIANKLQDNNTELANYLAELLIRDYGTHYVSSVDAGAVIAKTDYINTTYSDTKTKTVMKASASASFFSVLSAGASYTHTTTIDTGYNKSMTDSEISSHGGPPYRASNFTLNNWEDGIPNTLVAIDRAGDPLSYAITMDTLPDLPDVMVELAAETVDKAITRYYRVNSRYGCTDRYAPNFNFQANVDDNSCKLPTTNFTFGGVYQRCSNVNDQSNVICSMVQQKNPLTGDFSCSHPYRSILLHEGVVTKTVSEQVCHTSWWRKKCQNVLMSKQARYQSYWCVAMPGTDIPENTGYLFGGFYTSKEGNLLTGTRSCPKYYIPLKMLQDVTLCVSDSYETARDNSLSFAGFESCMVGNPLAVPDLNDATNPSSWPHDCPPHYTPQLVTVDGDCEVDFCIHNGVFGTKSILPIKMPPFRKLPKLKPNVTKTLSIISPSGAVWLKNESGVWFIEDVGPRDGLELVTELNLLPPDNGTRVQANGGQKNEALPNGVVAVVSVIGTLVLGAVILVAMILGKRFLWKPRTYHNIN